MTAEDIIEVKDSWSRIIKAIPKSKLPSMLGDLNAVSLVIDYLKPMAGAMSEAEERAFEQKAKSLNLPLDLIKKLLSWQNQSVINLRGFFDAPEKE